MNQGLKSLAMLALAILLLLSLGRAASIEVKPGESIQAAIDGAVSGDEIIVQSGAYKESLNITKPLSMIGIGHPQIDGGSADSAMLLYADGVSISGFDITSTRRTGIYILSNRNTLQNNTISGCLDGIFLEGSASNTVAFNDINNNTAGIFLFSSDGNVISNNSIKDNHINEESDCGIALVCSRDNIIQYNHLMNNGDSSLSLRSSVNNAVLENQIISNDWYGISLAESSNNNLIEKNNVSGNKDAGIYLDSSKENIIRDNSAWNNSRGILLSYDSNDNLLRGNRITSNQKGVHLASHSSNNTVENNTAAENGYGIYLNDYNAYDLGKSNRWDNGTTGNHYSGLGETYYIPGGTGVDRHPLAAPG
ncbi:MAG: right-handed parallel beta-helix repeat-containing protein [Methanothrix sp.]|nr:right-handed parallel beta-helix repeat-containing protein [Methanothrix sp.]